MYSEHGFDALMRPPAGQVCQSLMVVSYCTPRSAQAQAACATLSHSSRAPTALATLPSMRRIRFHSPSASTVRRHSSDTRTELLEFWPVTVREIGRAPWRGRVGQDVVIPEDAGVINKKPMHNN